MGAKHIVKCQAVHCTAWGASSFSLAHIIERRGRKTACRASRSTVRPSLRPAAQGNCAEHRRTLARSCQGQRQTGRTSDNSSSPRGLAVGRVPLSPSLCPSRGRCEPADSIKTPQSTGSTFRSETCLSRRTSSRGQPRRQGPRSGAAVWVKLSASLSGALDGRAARACCPQHCCVATSPVSSPSPAAAVDSERSKHGEGTAPGATLLTKSRRHRGATDTQSPACR